MKKLALVCFFFVGSCIYGNAKNSSAGEIIQQLKDEFQKRYNAHDADPAINDMVQSVLQRCNFKRPVIVLQSDSTSYACVHGKPDLSTQEFMMIGTLGQDISQIESTIYHEVGHLVNGDISRKRQQQESLYANGSKALTLSTGIGTALVLKKYAKQGYLLSSFFGGIASATFFCLGIAFINYQARLKEYKADVFAYNQLVKHDKLDIALAQIADYICQHEQELKSERRALPLFLMSYPSVLERAKIGLDVLRQQGINISDILQNLPKDLDPGIKKCLPDKIEKFFPSYV